MTLYTYPWHSKWYQIEKMIERYNSIEFKRLPFSKMMEEFEKDQKLVGL